MSDDVREVMRPTPFSGLKRVARSGDHKDGTERQSGDFGGSEEEGKQGRDAEAFETLRREVEGANERLRAAGKSLRLKLAGDADAPVIEIILPRGAGEETVTRRIAPDEIQMWVGRIETAEGLVIDEKM